MPLPIPFAFPNQNGAISGTLCSPSRYEETGPFGSRLGPQVLPALSAHRLRLATRGGETGEGGRENVQKTRGGGGECVVEWGQSRIFPQRGRPPLRRFASAKERVDVKGRRLNPGGGHCDLLDLRVTNAPGGLFWHHGRAGSQKWSTHEASLVGIKRHQLKAFDDG